MQQFAKNAQGATVSPKEAVAEANAVFKASPVSASLSGLWPRMIGVLLKRIPKVGILTVAALVDSPFYSHGVLTL